MKAASLWHLEAPQGIFIGVDGVLQTLFPLTNRHQPVDSSLEAPVLAEARLLVPRSNYHFLTPPSPQGQVTLLSVRGSDVPFSGMCPQWENRITILPP